MGRIIPYIMEKIYLKPPTIYIYIYIYNIYNITNPNQYWDFNLQSRPSLRVSSQEMRSEIFHIKTSQAFLADQSCVPIKTRIDFEMNFAIFQTLDGPCWVDTGGLSKILGYRGGASLNFACKLHAWNQTETQPTNPAFSQPQTCKLRKTWFISSKFQYPCIIMYPYSIQKKHDNKPKHGPNDNPTVQRALTFLHRRHRPSRGRGWVGSDGDWPGRCRGNGQGKFGVFFGTFQPLDHGALT